MKRVVTKRNSGNEGRGQNSAFCGRQLTDRIKFKQRILVVMTGGTIDSVFEPIKDTIIPATRTEVSNYLKTLKLYNRFS